RVRAGNGNIKSPSRSVVVGGGVVTGDSTRHPPDGTGALSSRRRSALLAPIDGVRGAKVSDPPSAVDALRTAIRRAECGSCTSIRSVTFWTTLWSDERRERPIGALLAVRIEFVNHASFLVEYDDVRLLVDPWLEGRIFNNGWDLITKTSFTFDDFARVTH